MSPHPLPVAVRAWTEQVRPAQASRASAPDTALHRAPPWPRSPYVLVFDTETTTDAAQALNFGVYHVCRWAEDSTLRLEQEGLFYADALPTRDPAGYGALAAYAERHDFSPKGIARRW